jgi:Domain of unknown function (DUF4270)
LTEIKRVLYFFLSIGVVYLAGCRENVLMNSKISPSNHDVGVYQKNLSCITHTQFSDTVLTSTNIGIPIYQAIGAISDPYFGVTSGTTFFQVIPSSLGFTFAATDTIDSAILVLPYAGFTYGDTANRSITQTFQVFALTDSLGDPILSNYYSFNTKSTDVNNPLSAPFTFNVYHLQDSVLVSGKNHAGLRIKLNLKNLLPKLNAALSADSTTASQATFISAFPGLCIRSADSRKTAGALPYFELDGTDPFSQAGILVYYHEHPSDTSYTQFYFNPTYCAHFNNVVSSYGHYPVSKLYASNEKNDSVVAIQNLPGAELDLKIYGISSLPAGIINKAELQISLLPAYKNDLFAYPEKLYVTGVATATYPSNFTKGELYNVADRYPLTSLTPLSVMDGYPHLNFGTYNSTTYTINIPRELMQAIAQKSDTIHLLINATQDYYGAFRLIAGGGNNSDSTLRAKLKVVYSQLN